MEGAKRRSPVIAVLLSIILPGLGQVYNGRFLRGLLLHCSLLLFFVALGLTGLIYSPLGFLGITAIIAVAYVFIARDAAIGARHVNMMHLKWYNRWWAYVGCMLCSVLALEPAIGWAAPFAILDVDILKMSESSMIPTLEPGERFFATLERYGDRLPARGDIIIFRHPSDPSRSFVKRVIGLPGERLEIKDKVVFINDQPLDDPWGVRGSTQIPQRDNLGPITIPPNSVFVLGDNRDFSHDSRFWGCVVTDIIRGRPMFIYSSNDPKRVVRRIR